MKIRKLNKGFSNEDNCNTAMKETSLIMMRVMKSAKIALLNAPETQAAIENKQLTPSEMEKNLKKYQVFCMHHMRCTIFEGMSKRVSTFLQVRLTDYFDQISYHLHVSPIIKN